MITVEIYDPYGYSNAKALKDIKSLLTYLTEFFQDNESLSKHGIKIDINNVKVTIEIQFPVKIH